MPYLPAPLPGPPLLVSSGDGQELPLALLPPPRPPGAPLPLSCYLEGEKHGLRSTLPKVYVSDRTPKGSLS